MTTPVVKDTGFTKQLTPLLYIKVPKSKLYRKDVPVFHWNTYLKLALNFKVKLNCPWTHFSTTSKKIELQKRSYQPTWSYMILIKRIVCIGVSPPPQKHYPLFLASLPPPSLNLQILQNFIIFFLSDFTLFFYLKIAPPPPPDLKNNHPLFPSNPPIIPLPPSRKGEVHTMKLYRYLMGSSTITKENCHLRVNNCLKSTIATLNQDQHPCALFYPAEQYLLKINYRNNRKRCKICSKLKIKTR